MRKQICQPRNNEKLKAQSEEKNEYGKNENKYENRR